MGRPRKNAAKIDQEEAPKVNTSFQLKYKSNGSIDWRAMIQKEHLALNIFNYACRGVDLNSLDQDSLSKMLDEAKEEDIVIKLAGFRELARIRGFKKIDTSVVSSRDSYVAIKVSITWLPSIENPEGLEVSAIASASLDSVDSAFAKYLETIAENRAFVRAVRHSLGIIAVGQDEIKQEDVKVNTNNIKLHSLLLEEVSRLGLNLSDLKSLFTREELPWEDKWVSIDKIDPHAVLTIIPILKKIQ